MWKFYSILASILLVHWGQSAPTVPVDCSGLAMNGVKELGCWGFWECVNGQAIRHDCTAVGKVLERDTLTCVITGNTECPNIIVDCRLKDDGMYADLGGGCQTYSRCYRKTNVGRLYCPASLVFNEAVQTCDYPSNVLPPCGTAPVPDTTPAF